MQRPGKPYSFVSYVNLREAVWSTCVHLRAAARARDATTYRLADCLYATCARVGVAVVNMKVYPTMTYEWDISTDHGGFDGVVDLGMMDSDAAVLGSRLQLTGQIVGIAGPGAAEYWAFINRTYPGVSPEAAAKVGCTSGVVALGSRVRVYDTADDLHDYLTDPLYALDDDHPVGGWRVRRTCCRVQCTSSWVGRSGAVGCADGAHAWTCVAASGWRRFCSFASAHAWTCVAA